MLDFPTAQVKCVGRPGMKWPAILQDAEQLRTKTWNKLWEEFTASWPHWRMNAKPPEHLHDAGKIREQWIAGGVCAIIGVAAGFILVRTLGRHLAIDETAIRTAEGKRVPFSHIVRLDLRTLFRLTLPPAVAAVAVAVALPIGFDRYAPQFAGAQMPPSVLLASPARCHRFSLRRRWQQIARRISPALITRAISTSSSPCLHARAHPPSLLVLLR